MASTAKGHAQQLDYLVGRIEAAMAELDQRKRHIEAMLAELGEVKTRAVQARGRPSAAPRKA
jgi:hypothetical protein